MKQATDTLIIDEFLQLRLPRITMATELLAVVDRERDQLREWLFWVDNTTSLEDSQRFLKESNLFNRGGQRLTSFIYYKDQLVGSVGLVQIDKKNRKAELGYWLSSEVQGQGIMTRACQHLIRYAFKQLSLHRMEMRIATANHPSIAVAERLGFTYEGLQREALLINGMFHDVAWYGLINVEKGSQSS